VEDRRRCRLVEVLVGCPVRSAVVEVMDARDVETAVRKQAQRLGLRLETELPDDGELAVTCVRLRGHSRSANHGGPVTVRRDACAVAPHLEVGAIHSDHGPRLLTSGGVVVLPGTYEGSYVRGVCQSHHERGGASHDGHSDQCKAERSGHAGYVALDKPPGYPAKSESTQEEYRRIHSARNGSPIR
jgi:hypothetical protein